MTTRGSTTFANPLRSAIPPADPAPPGPAIQLRSEVVEVLEAVGSRRTFSMIRKPSVAGVGDLLGQGDQDRRPPRRDGVGEPGRLCVTAS